MTSASQYLYDHVTTKVLMDDMSFRAHAPQPGDHLPEFDLPTVDGGQFSTRDFIGKKPLLLITGSYSCPMTASSNPILKEFYNEFGSDIAFVMIQVREAHPGEHTEQPHSTEEKIKYANALKSRDDLPWPIAIDSVTGELHRALDEKPNALWLTNREGLIVYRSLWAGDDAGLEQALDAVCSNRTPALEDSSRRVGPMAMGVGKMREMTQQSGPRATHDMWRAAPPMAAMALVADFFQPLPPKWRTFAALATIGLSIAAVTSFITKRRSN
ncbi:MAG: hypothetical protein CTY33_03000 [Methylotenera sp.]|nr:MAG: hypothetical protein CTY33_03000 [Methylotenera sp.]